MNAFTISISFLFQNLYEHAIDWFKCLMSCILILRTDAVAVMGLESCVAAKICIWVCKQPKLHSLRIMIICLSFVFTSHILFFFGPCKLSDSLNQKTLVKIAKIFFLCKYHHGYRHQVDSYWKDVCLHSWSCCTTRSKHTSIANH